MSNLHFPGEELPQLEEAEVTLEDLESAVAAWSADPPAAEFESVLSAEVE